MIEAVFCWISVWQQINDLSIQNSRLLFLNIIFSYIWLRATNSSHYGSLEGHSLFTVCNKLLSTVGCAARIRRTLSTKSKTVSVWKQGILVLLLHSSSFPEKSSSTRAWSLPLPAAFYFLIRSSDSRVPAKVQQIGSLVEHSLPQLFTSVSHQVTPVSANTWNTQVHPLQNTVPVSGFTSLLITGTFML